MPNDSVRNRTFRELFEGKVRFEIPFFQRGYAWEKRQWDQLFEDITREILPDIDDGTGYREIEHFFGPIVVLQRTDTGAGLAQYLVIDGQQRITTIYLLLGIIMERLSQLQGRSGDALKHVLSLRPTLANEPVTDDDYERLKVFSTKGDRLPTYRTIFGADQRPTSPHYYVDIDLYQPGNNQVDAFKTYADKRLKQICRDVPSLVQFANVLLDSLRIVWIPLEDGKDDPQAIFESLNDRGMPLSSSELICSYIFRPLEKVSDFEQLHNDQWLGAIRKFRNRADFEEYLRNLFSIGTAKMIGKGRRVYVSFKNRTPHLNVATARHHLEEIHESANLYQMIVSPAEHRHPSRPIAGLLEAIKCTRMDSSAPFLIDVLRVHKTGGIPDELVLQLLSETLTMLVRRKMTEETTTIYDTMFPRLFGQVAREAYPVHALQEIFRRNGVWTSDQEFRAAFVNQALYRSRDLAFTRMVLIELDKSMQRHGQFADYTTVSTVEHIIPQTLDSAWKSYLGSDGEDPLIDRKVNSIGNLCLASGSANSSVGQNPFDSKVRAYSEVTALARDLKAHVGIWDLNAVMSRSRRLGDIAAQRWSWSA